MDSAARDQALRTARIHAEAGRPAEAEAIYRALILADQGDIAALTGIAALWLDYGAAAPVAKVLDRALALAPHDATALALSGRVAEAEGRAEAAAAQYHAAVRNDPRLAWAQLGLGRMLARLGRLDEAAAALATALRSQTDDVAAMMLAHVCDWSRDAGPRVRLRARLARPEPLVFDTYAVLAREDDPAVLALAGERMAGAVAAHVAGHVAGHVAVLARPASRKARNGGKIRLGYLSADFHRHATALLMTAVFERHDRDRFEVTAYSYSRDDKTPERRRVVAAFDRFVELGMEPPAETARRIEADGIDILVDLKGYVTGARPEIPALRPAPVQVSHLGYPGPMAAEWYDYVIADPVVLPFAEQPHWRERIVQLPHSYQPNDRSRPLPAPAARATHGLPDDAFVFACFNNSYKITPEVFAAWMELLREVPGAVLWLYSDNDFAAGNLRAAAVRHGVEAVRLVFARTLDLPAHLARHGCADLFLDTSPYGAHTTGADALWAGLPLVTWTGRCFAARVAASLLHAVGLPELVADSLEGYRALALALARDPARLAALRARLAAARETAPLFDAARFARNLDAAYGTMMELHAAGPARAFRVREDGPPLFAEDEE